MFEKKRNIFLIVLIVFLISVAFLVSASGNNYDNDNLPAATEQEQQEKDENAEIAGIIERNIKATTIGINSTINYYYSDLVSDDEKQKLVEAYENEIDQVYADEAHIKQRTFEIFQNCLYGEGGGSLEMFFTNFGIFQMDIKELKIEGDTAYVTADIDYWVSNIYTFESGYDAYFIENGDLMDYNLKKVDGSWKITYSNHVGYKKMDATLSQRFDNFEEAYEYSLSKTPENILESRGDYPECREKERKY